MDFVSKCQTVPLKQNYVQLSSSYQQVVVKKKRKDKEKPLVFSALLSYVNLNLLLGWGGLELKGWNDEYISANTID